MKTYVITVSQTFPKTHKRSGQKTGFPELILSKVKLHTIRQNYALWNKRIQEVQKGNAILSIRVWEGKPYNSKQREILQLDSSTGIGIQRIEFYEDKDNIPSWKYPLIDNYSEPAIETVAENDGLFYNDFREWFKKADFSEPMAIIHFTKFRY